MADDSSVARLHAPTDGRTGHRTEGRTHICPDDTTAGADRHDLRADDTTAGANCYDRRAGDRDRATGCSHPERLAGKQADPTNSSWM